MKHGLNKGPETDTVHSLVLEILGILFDVEFVVKNKSKCGLPWYVCYLQRYASSHRSKCCETFPSSLTHLRARRMTTTRYEKVREKPTAKI